MKIKKTPVSQKSAGLQVKSSVKAGGLSTYNHNRRLLG